MLAYRVACAFMTCGRHGGATSEFPVDASVVREMLIHINAVSRNETYHDEVTTHVETTTEPHNGNATSNHSASPRLEVREVDCEMKSARTPRGIDARWLIENTKMILRKKTGEQASALAHPAAPGSAWAMPWPHA